MENSSFNNPQSISSLRDKFIKSRTVPISILNDANQTQGHISLLADLSRNLALRFVMAGEYKRALPIFEFLTCLPSSTLTDLLAEIMCRVSLGDVECATSCISRMRLVDPHEPLLMLIEARCFEMGGHLKRAKSAYESFIEANSSMSSYHISPTEIDLASVSLAALNARLSQPELAEKDDANVKRPLN